MLEDTKLKKWMGEQGIEIISPFCIARAMIKPRQYEPGYAPHIKSMGYPAIFPVGAVNLLDKLTRSANNIIGKGSILI